MVPIIKWMEGYVVKKLCIVLFVTYTVFLGAGLSVVNSLRFGGNGNDLASDILVEEDGSVLISGYTDSSTGTVFSSHGEEDFLVVKLDDNLDLQWWNSFGGSGRDIAEAIAVTKDGGYVLAGLTESNDGDVSGNRGIGDFWVIKLSQEGELLWQKTFGGSGQDHAYDVLERPSGSIVVGGYTRSNDGDVSGYDWGEDFWIIELDSEGNLLSQWIKGGYRSEDCVRRLIQDEDGSLYAVGYFAYRDCGISCNYVENQMSILRISSGGEIDWFTQFGSRYFEDGFDIVTNTVGGVIAIGSQDAGVSLFSNGLGGKDFWVISVDDEGNELWSKNYGGSFKDVARSVVLADYAGVIVAGQTTSDDSDVSGNSGMTDAWIVHIDSTGKIVESLTFGSSGDDVIHSAFSKRDTIVYAGYSTSAERPGVSSGAKDLWVIEAEK